MPLRPKKTLNYAPYAGGTQLNSDSEDYQKWASYDINDPNRPELPPLPSGGAQKVQGTKWNAGVYFGRNEPKMAAGNAFSNEKQQAKLSYLLKKFPDGREKIGQYVNEIQFSPFRNQFTDTDLVTQAQDKWIREKEAELRTKEGQSKSGGGLRTYGVKTLKPGMNYIGSGKW